MRMPRAPLTGGFVLGLAIGFLQPSPAGAQPPAGIADFNGDGFGDLAIGAPGHANGAGGVHVLYGSANGLTDAGDQFLSQDTPGVAGGEEADDNCGGALATGDFDGDGFTDLAVGCPGESLDSGTSVGVVLVLYGSPVGLTGAGSQFWHQNATGVGGANESNDACGSSLATGDFNQDGRADLAWGCPGEASGGATRASGAVMVLYGSATGLTAAGNQFWSQGSPGVPGTPNDDDRCAAALVAADFNNDQRSDLAFGCPGEDIPIAAPLPVSLPDAGAAVVLYGSASGLTGTGSVLISQTPRLVDGAEAFDRCGAALAAGDFNHDGHSDLAMGCPGEDLFLVSVQVVDAGAVDIRNGAANGFTVGLLDSTLRFLSQCGSSLATGNVDDDRFADLAVGCPGVELVQVRHGSGFGLAAPQSWSQNTAGIAGATESGDGFGTALTFGDFNGDGYDDLAVGVPGEEGTGVSDAGAINIINGSANGLTAAGNRLFSQDTPGIVGATDPFERFGFALSGSGGTAAPGLTGTWRAVTQSRVAKKRGVRTVLRGTFAARNPSTQSTPKVALRFYLSADPTLDDDDPLVDEARVRALAVGEEQERRFTAVLPEGLDATGLFVIAFVDADDIVVEANEQNNIVPFGPLP